MLIWTAIAATGTALAAVYSGVQLQRSRLEPMRRATLEQLSILDERMRPMLFHSPAAQRETIIRCYRAECDMTEEAAKYLSFLNALDLAAFAAKHGLIDAKMFAEHARTLTTAEMVPLSFLVELQKCCDDPFIYEHLRGFLQEEAATVRHRKPLAS